jgi:hypothetical protein
MFAPLNRRHFVVNSVNAGAAAGLGDLAFLHNLQPVSADEATITPAMVQFHSDIEPLVRLVEDTQRQDLLEVVAGRIRRGTTYQQLLSALMLAGVRSIKPRPVGFKFHAVLVVNSAHLASLASPDSDRWLPLFWALDNFKVSQAKNKEESGGWQMPAVDVSKLPPGQHAKQRFMEAMDNWDEEGADRAISALVRHAGATEVIELFWRYGCRDFRDIGHKAIYAANAWRALQTIGWRHAEPVMRSLAFAMLEHDGGNPNQRDDDKDRPGRENLKRLTKIRAEWRYGKIDRNASLDLVEAVRRAKPADCSEKVVELLNRGVAAESIWDALFLSAGELLMRQPGIGGLHTFTTMNALHFAYQTTGSDATQRLLMLQGAAFLPMFRDFMQGRGKLRDDIKINELKPAEGVASGTAGIEEIMNEVSKDKVSAAQKTLRFVAGDASNVPELMTAARRLIFMKGNDSHDYKFSSAALEDYYHVTPAWRNQFLASSMAQLRGAGDRDNSLIKRARTLTT